MMTITALVAKLYAKNSHRRLDVRKSESSPTSSCGYLFFRIILMSMLIACNLIVVGCGRSDSNWYAFDGGKINLSRITRVGSDMKITIVWEEKKDIQNLGKEQFQRFYGSITKENIDAIKNCIRAHGKEITGFRDCSAELEFDNHSIRLPIHKGEFKTEDLYVMVDSWLKITEDVLDRLR